MAKSTRYWFVMPTDVKGDGKFWYGPGNVVNQGDFEQVTAPATARGRAEAPRRANIIIEDEVAPAVDPGYGFGLQSKEQKEMMVFTTKGKATEYAKNRAAKSPGVLFGVFSCDQVFETTEPDVITKTFNDAGELVLVGN